MKLTAYPKTIFCLALLLCWGSCAPPAVAQSAPQWRSIVIVSPLQTVEVHTPRDSYNAVFESDVLVFPKGEASGFQTLSVPERFPHMGGINITYADGHAKWHHNTFAGVLLLGRTEEGDPVVVMITPAATEDCLIYTTVGSEINATWEAQGYFRICDGPVPCTFNSPRD